MKRLTSALSFVLTPHADQNGNRALSAEEPSVVEHTGAVGMIKAAFVEAYNVKADSNLAADSF
jgi:hypothetical protein